MQVGRFTVTVEPFFAVLVGAVCAVGLLADDVRLQALPPVALLLLLARTLGAFAAGWVALLGGARWAMLTVAMFPSPTAAGAPAPWARRLEPAAGLVAALTTAAAGYLLQAALAPTAPVLSDRLELASSTVGIFLLLCCVPMLPLDGGNVLQALLPGGPVRRVRLAGLVSVLSGLVLIALAVQAGLWLVVLGLSVVLWLNVCKAAGRTGRRQGGHVCGHSCDVLTTLYLSGHDAALAVHRRLRRETDPVLTEVLERWHSPAAPGTTQAVAASWAGREDDDVTRGAYLLWCARADRRADLTATVVDARPVALVPMMVAVHEAARNGADREVVLLAERVLHTVSCSSLTMSAVALQSSRSRMRLGDLDRAVAT